MVVGPADIYVSPTGDDSNPGTKEKPLKTVAAAQTAARAHAKRGKEPLVVGFLPGTYYVGKTVVFTTADSGAKDASKQDMGANMDEIKGIARVTFHPGKVEEWKRLSKEAMAIVRSRDSGTLQYEIFLNEDETEAIVFERYRDADAAIEHFSNISHLMEPILATASVTGEVLGTPNAAIKELIGKAGPKLFTPWMVFQEPSTTSRRVPSPAPRRKKPKVGRKTRPKKKRRSK